MSSFIAAMLLMIFNPAFGRKPDRRTQTHINNSFNYKSNKFMNAIPTITRMSLRKFFRATLCQDGPFALLNLSFPVS